MASDIFESVQFQTQNLPNKLNFKIGEVARFLGVKSHTLRYWENTFPLLSPKKFHNGQRIYAKQDIELLFLIKDLLYTKKYSIKGTKENLSNYYREMKRQTPFLSQQHFIQAKRLNSQLKRLLEKISATKALLDQKHGPSCTDSV